MHGPSVVGGIESSAWMLSEASTKWMRDSRFETLAGCIL
jgi:hypothetical protein